MYLNRIVLFFSVTIIVIFSPNVHAQAYLWGMTASNSKSPGVIFKTDSNGNNYSNVYIFNNPLNGTKPYGSLIVAKDGNLYGMTSEGGANNYGVIFQLNPATGIYTKKHDFDSVNGMTPYGSLCQASNGKLYGMTNKGGTYVTQFPTANRGVLFEYDPTTGSFSNKAELIKSKIGSPYGSFIQAKDGLLYGLSSFGGVDATGALFSYDASASNLKLIGGFVAGSQFVGYEPNGDLIQASNNIFYGLSRYGEAIGSGGGVIFSYDATIIVGKSVKSLHKFSELMPGAIEGYDLVGSLIQASNGKLYGMTRMGGTNDIGTIFEFDLVTGKHKKLYDFDSVAEGFHPFGSLMQASNGKLYGLTTSENGQSKLFQFDLNTNSLVIKANVTGTPFYTTLIEVKEPTTSVNHVSYQNKPYVFPNPATNKLYIRGTKPDAVINITSIDGKVLFQQVCDNGIINISTLQNGTYYINISQAQNLLYSNTIVVMH